MSRARALLAGALAVAVALTGCGGGSGRSSSPAKPAPEARQLYHWLVPTTGSPPTIAQENSKRGTVAWRLPGPGDLIGGEAHGPIEGYVSSDAVLPGQIERVYVNAPAAHRVALSMYRMGWYGGRGGRLVMQSELLPAQRQPGCTHHRSTGLTECDWHPTLSFVIPPALSSGVYIIRLDGTDGSQADCIFIVRSRRPAPLLVELPTASWQAYNQWGGDSLYPGGKTVEATGSSQGVEVSFDRPYETQTGAGQFFIREVAAVRFFERYGYPVSYTTIDSLDAEPQQVAGVRALIDVGHSEYWSKRDEQAFESARDAGSDLIFLSSDTAAWRVRYAPATGASSQAREPDHRIVAYKEYASDDPEPAQITGITPHGAAELVGSAYDGCITPRVSQPGPPVYRYYSWVPTTLRPTWLFAHTGITSETGIPGIVGYELDERTPASPPGTEVVGEGTAPCGSEAEPSPVRGTLAQTTLYTARSGAFVFASGTLGWLYGLSPVPQASPDAPTAPDPRVVAMTRNLLAHALVR